MAKVELKQPIVQEISEKIDGAQSLVLVDHRGLTVQQDTELRKQLREAGVFYKVYKNTMMNFAFKGTPFEGLSDLLNGPSAESSMSRVSRKLLRSLPERSCSEDCLAACSLLSQTSPVLSSRSRRRMAKAQLPRRHNYRPGEAQRCGTDAPHTVFDFKIDYLKRF